MARPFQFRFETMLKLRRQREDEHKRVVAERLRITPTPLHSDALVDALRDALVETWNALGISWGAADRPAVAKSDRVIPLLVPTSGG